MRCWQHKHAPVARPKRSTTRRRASSGARSIGQRRTTVRRTPNRNSRGNATRRSRAGRKPTEPRDRSYDRLTPAKQERVDSAIQFCADAVTDGWQEAVAGRAADYASSETFRKLIRARRRRHCKALAEVAKLILAAKAKAHELLGVLGGGVLSLFGLGDLAKRFARELIEHIPLPLDAKAIAAARGVQVTGVLLCLLNGEDLRRCQCFIDLALEQSKTAVKKIMTTAMEDWTQLAWFGAKA
ncbi:hypothetical protein [Kribbella sp. NBC_00359]|uniref:hypothetical protein n=1 Tax=Kribbella sp. NBC_00359 TaxID=2975966 RepID=UPI002E1DAFC9